LNLVNIISRISSNVSSYRNSTTWLSVLSPHGSRALAASLQRYAPAVPWSFTRSTIRDRQYHP